MPKQKKSNKLQIKSCIICEIARKELGGKDSLMGVFAHTIMTQEIPFMVPFFAIWIEMKAEKLKYDSLEIQVMSPDGKMIVGAKGSLEFSEINDFVGIPFQLPALIFPLEGIYKVRFGYDNDMAEVGQFEVRKGTPPTK